MVNPKRLFIHEMVTRGSPTIKSAGAYQALASWPGALQLADLLTIDILIVLPVPLWLTGDRLNLTDNDCQVIKLKILPSAALQMVLELQGIAAAYRLSSEQFPALESAGSGWAPAPAERRLRLSAGSAILRYFVHSISVPFFSLCLRL